MHGHDVIAIGASAGGVNALQELFRSFPPQIPAAVFVVLHIASEKPSLLPEILGRQGTIPASHPEDGEPIRPGRIYVAPPDRHLLIRDGRVRLTRGPRENSSRPAIDPLFRTAAVQYGPRVVGVVLTGLLDDGAAGLAAVKQCGGKAVVQDPDDAPWPDMPRNAIASVEADFCVPLGQIPSVLLDLMHRRHGRKKICVMDEDIQFQIAREKSSDSMRKRLERMGEPSQLSCPECNGPVWETREAGLLHFRCEVGHGFNPESFGEAQASRIDRALWSSVSALEDKAAFARRLARRMRQCRMGDVAARYDRESAEASLQADLIRNVILGKVKPPPSARAPLRRSGGRGGQRVDVNPAARAARRSGVRRGGERR